VGRNRKAWGVSPRNLRACKFSKPQRGRHGIVPAQRREPFHVTPLGLKTKRATRVSLAPGSWGSRPLARSPQVLARARIHPHRHALVEVLRNLDHGPGR
jgi:hypothetical protein